MKLVRYAVSGSLMTLFVLLLVFLFANVLALPYLAASSLAVLIATGIGYVVHKYWTFRNRDAAHVRQFSSHAALTAWNFVLNGMLMLFFVGSLGFPPVVGQAATSLTVAAETFLLYRFVIFRERAA